MNRIGAQLRMHYLNSKRSYVIFWSIILFVTVVGIITAFYLKSRGFEGQITTNNITATVVFCAISSAVAYYETFPYTLNMGCTRKDYTYGFMVYNIALSFTLAFINNLLMIGEYLVCKGFGYNVNLYGYTAGEIGLLQEYGYVVNIINFRLIFSNILLLMTFLMAIAALFTLLTIINYLKGTMYLFGIGGLIIVLMFLPKIRVTFFESMWFIFMTFAGKVSPVKLTLYSLAVFAICYILIFPIVRVTEVKK